jgi:uncharacterized membrane protein YgcG
MWGVLTPSPPKRKGEFHRNKEVAVRPSTKVFLTLMGAFVLILTVSRDADGLWALSLGIFLACLLIAYVFRDFPDESAGQTGSADRHGGAGYDGGGRSGDGGFGDGGGGGD